MALHDTLRALVAARGPAVVDEAEEFRGALDDFLTEDEATTGEINLLVDAVRLGAVRRLVASLRQGADPQHAVPEAGAMLARDRGSEEQARSAWAVAVIGYGLGVLGADAVAAAIAGIGTIEAVPRPGTVQLPDEPARASAPTPDRTPDAPTAGGGGTLPPPPPPLPPPPGPAAEPRSRTGRMVLGVIAAAVVVGVGTGVGFAVLGGGDDDSSAGRDPGTDTSATTTEPSDDSGSGHARVPKGIPETSIIASFDLDGQEDLYSIDYRTGLSQRLTDGGVEQLPTVTPDRMHVVYLEHTATAAKRLRVFTPSPRAPRTGDLVFPAGNDCEYANRPGFKSDGTTFALVCTDADRNPVGLYQGALDGSSDLLSADPSWWGAPTWMDDSTLVITRTVDEHTELWQMDVADPDNPTQLTDGGGESDDYPDWSAQAGRLLFLRYQEDPASNTQVGTVYTYDPDTGKEEPLATEGPVSHPAWSPDGTRIVCLVTDDAGDERLAWVSLEHPETFHFPNVGLQGNPTAPAWGTR